jgi:protein AroM
MMPHPSIDLEALLEARVPEDDLPWADRGTLGLITVGQTPRPDFEALFGEHAPGTAIRIVGALDGLTTGEVARLASRRDHHPLLVRLADGSATAVPARRVIPRVKRAARRLASEGASLVVVLCAGAFPRIDCGVPVIIPGRLLPAVMRAATRTRRLGIVTPIAGQADAARAKWESDGFSVKVTWASPTRHDEIAIAAAAMSDPDLEFVVLDCLGHNEAYRDEFGRLCGRPVVAAQTLVARVVGALIG